MHHPESLRSTLVRFAMVPAALLCVALSACADRQPTEPNLRPIARDVSVPFNRFFIAWSATPSTNPIQTQVFALDASQNRQYADFADERTLAFARANPGRLYINGDEPDQYCAPPDQYAVTYHDFVTTLRSVDPTARVSPAGFAEPNWHCCPLPDDVPAPCWSAMHSIGYAQQFYDAYVHRYGSAPPVNEWRFHDFAITFAAGEIDRWWDRVETEVAWSAAHGANMVLGSWGFMQWREPASAYQEHLKEAMGRIMNEPRIVEAVYWARENMIYSTHPLVASDWSLTPEGQVYVNPLTDVPAGPTIVDGDNGQAKLTWGNTTVAWSAEAEFWVKPAGSSTFVYNNTERVAGPGASETPVDAFHVGDSVMGRVRYYNPYGQAAWSSFSAPVVMTGDVATKSSGAGKSPRYCVLPTGGQSQTCG